MPRCQEKLRVPSPTPGCPPSYCINMYGRSHKDKNVKKDKKIMIISIFCDFSMSTGEKKQMRKDGNLPNEEKM